MIVGGGCLGPWGGGGAFRSELSDKVKVLGGGVWKRGRRKFGEEREGYMEKSRFGLIRRGQPILFDEFVSI